MEAREGPDPEDKAEFEYVVDFTSSVYMTLGVADTHWHPQFFSAITCNTCAL